MKRLLIVPPDPIKTYRANGHEPRYLSRLFNPAGAADEVGILDVHQDAGCEWPGFSHRWIAVPRCEALEAWAGTAAQGANGRPEDGRFLRDFASLPEEWVRAAREFAPDCVRGYSGGWTGLIACELARALGAPGLVSIHDTHGIAPSVVRRASLVMASSEAVVEKAIQAGADPARVVTVDGCAASEVHDISRTEQREAGLYRWLVSPRHSLVSVVLPTFNRAHLIETAVRNVLAQDYRNLELIVVNDGSTDATAERLGRLERELADPRLRVITKKNGGLPRALNSGFEQARGKYLTWTSDDNLYRPGAISAMVRELELDREVVLVFADFQIIGADGKPSKVMEMGPVKDITWRNVVGACFLYRREAASIVGAYDPSMELAEDYDYWVRLARVGKLVRLSRVLYDCDAGPDRLTWRRAVEVGQAAARVIRRHCSKRDLHNHMVSLAIQYKWHGWPLKSFTTAMSLIARFPLSLSGYWAAARAMTPLALLRMTHKVRGLDAQP